MAPTADRLLLSEAHRRAMLAHLRACLPEEACGLLGGVLGDPTRGLPARCQAVLPVPNALHSPVRFRMAPEEQLKAFYWLEEQGLDLLAIFHSHPTGPSHPSATDLAEFAYPGVLYLIWSPGLHGPDWQLHAFRLSAGAYTLVDIATSTSATSTSETCPLASDHPGDERRNPSSPEGL